jgi:hypothetical protein
MPHTPRPWIVFSHGSDGPYDVMPAMREGDIATGIKNGADADLIASAPALRDALEMVLTVWFDATATRADDERAEQAAKDALALARGE